MDAPELLNDSWETLCDALRAFGRHALEADGEQDRVEGIRHVLRFAGHLADYELEHWDPVRPRFWRVITPTRKFYGDGLDVDYDSARIDGANTYRISGTRGSVPYLAFIVYRNRKRDRVAGNVVIEPGDVGPDGSFELTLSPDLGARSGIELDDACMEVVARQYHHDPDAEAPASYEIQLVDQRSAPSALDEERAAAALQRIGMGLTVSPRRLTTLETKLRAAPNQFSDLDADGGAAFFGTTSNAYHAGWFSLEPGRALELTLSPTPARYLGVQLFNRWFESIDTPLGSRSSINHHQWRTDPDGQVRLRIGGRATSPNWLDPAGHREGIMLVRYLLPSGGTPPLPSCRIVPEEAR